MENRKHTRIEGENELNRLFGFDVLDNDGKSIGKVDNIWMDETMQPAFFGIQTGWLSGKLHVVPAHRAEVNFQQRRVRLPHSQEKVKEAPSYEASAELSPEEESEIYRYYNLEPARSEARETGPRETAEPEARPGETADEKILNLNEERVEVGKQEVGTGGVRLRKVIRTETIHEPVELKHEDVEIERIPADETARAEPGNLQEEEIYIPLRQEEAVVHKETRPREQIRATKKTETEKQDVSETARKEDIEIERGEERKYGT